MTCPIVPRNGRAMLVAMLITAPAIAAQQPVPAKTPRWEQPSTGAATRRATVAAAPARVATDVRPAVRAGEAEPNDDPETATAISVGDTIDATIASDTDTYFYRITLTAGTTVIVDVDAQAIGSNLDAMAGLMDPSGSTVNFSDDEDRSEERGV